MGATTPCCYSVVEDKVRRKKTKGVGVFQYAQTVEDKVWRDAKSQKEIQVCSMSSPLPHAAAERLKTLGHNIQALDGELCTPNTTESW